jgi:alpha-L-fucosidase
MTIDSLSWGYRRNAELKDFLSIEEIIAELTETVSCGGNILINVGPTKDGIIAPIFEERLRQMGSWLSMNGEAIYGTRPWAYQNDTINPNIWYWLLSSSSFFFIKKR